MATELNDITYNLMMGNWTQSIEDIKHLDTETDTFTKEIHLLDRNELENLALCLLYALKDTKWQ